MMEDTRRNQILACIEREFIGPDPIEEAGCLQENGEEILSGDPPHMRYIAGILFPKETQDENAEFSSEDQIEVNQDDNTEPSAADNEASKDDWFTDSDQAEDLINRSNAYKQSALSLTCAVQPGSEIVPFVHAATYERVKQMDSIRQKESVKYLRRPLEWNNDGNSIVMPNRQNPIVTIPVGNSKLQFDITWRYHRGGCDICTFTLENTNVCGDKTVSDGSCFFQVGFKLISGMPFPPLPESVRINTGDEDYQSNRLLYRNVHNYAIGHGCAADWEETEDGVKSISTAVFPCWEVKPIVPKQIDGVTLSMISFGPDGTVQDIVKTLTALCDQYEVWIEGLETRKATLDAKLTSTAQRHIQNCKTCLARMRDGIALLREDHKVQIAFQYMNLAMLQQQLHYNLPLQQWAGSGDEGLELINPVEELPDPKYPETWIGDRVYGQWRPFQIAFVLMNLRSMADRRCDSRKTVDLIWFPTGGGKTEAYLGLSAYTIFIRRLMNPDDDGTAILMRYTLRLLTAQQYERASAMICACELIRRNHEDLFGRARISIGLWVGSDTTPNHMKDAVDALSQLKRGSSSINPFVILKCPWCGAQMGPVRNGHPGYKTVKGAHQQKTVIFQCANKGRCAFSEQKYPLPLHVVDDEIYECKPTLLLGTVDKFAMLPFRPEAQKLFGIENGVRKCAPDLIIQDELHLISGPLGSMVGHYETMIDELCTFNAGTIVIKPKIIASTATISRAREQCNALYSCGKDRVFQFPPSGLDASDSFFAYENTKANGRQYVGIFAGASSSDTTTAIRLFSSLLYAVKDMKVNDEAERDAYWTNIGYFNSIRELGQAQTWIHQDIEQYLDTMYKRRHLEKKLDKETYRETRRYIYRDEELTSRIPSDKVTASLANLGIRFTANRDQEHRYDIPIDICLATNMISVGLDVPRLGLMTVSGQPKTTSEYIQATSRVGRDGKNAPGLVFVLYRPGRPRDRSHYEHFREYHSKLYCSVEPTSVTPFSSPVRDRALHAVMIGMMRLEQNDSLNENPPRFPTLATIDHVEKVIENRVSAIDPEEKESTEYRMRKIMRDWEDWNPQRWEPRYNPDKSFADALPLMYPWGRERNSIWGKDRSFETPTSMRSVDSTCEAEVLSSRYSEEEDD